VIYGNMKRNAEVGQPVDLNIARGCLYYIAFAYFRTMKFANCIQYANASIQENPNNVQAQAMVSLTVVRFLHLARLIPVYILLFRILFAIRKRLSMSFRGRRPPRKSQLCFLPERTLKVRSRFDSLPRLTE